MIALGWTLIALEALASAFFAYVFWHFWSRSAMPRALARRATAIYAAGCLACIIVTALVPL